jgi:2-aminoadipate transaminase
VLSSSPFARRAAELSAAFPAPHFPAELDPGVVALDSGFASPQVLPDLSRFALDALTTHREESLQYSAPQGHPELRAWLANYMNEGGCRLEAQNVLIVNGAKHGLDLICRLLVDEGDAIAVTAPTYFTALPIFRSFGAELIEIACDEHGIKVDELERLLEQRQALRQAWPKFIYNVADFHNPTGIAMARTRREALVACAHRQGIAIVEDNPYRRVRFEGDALPTLKALDRAGEVLHVGTFSKLIAPGLRIGWIAARADWIARLMQLKSDGGSNPLIQRIVLDFCRSADFAAHVDRVQSAYREHRDRMIAALRSHLPEWRMDVPQGGYYLWITLPQGVDGDELARRAAQIGVNIIAGSRFYASGGKQLAPCCHIRLSYSFASPAEIDLGIRRLADVYRAQLAA